MLNKIVDIWGKNECGISMRGAWWIGGGSAGGGERAELKGDLVRRVSFRL